VDFIQMEEEFLPIRAVSIARPKICASFQENRSMMNKNIGQLNFNVTLKVKISAV
jgi:hypothetical protein